MVVSFFSKSRTFTLLQRITAIFLLSIYLLSTTELGELCKFPVLVEHYIEHRSTNKDLTLIGYIIMHYGGSDHSDNDHQRDQQLPFKTHDNCSIQLLQVCPPAPFIPTLPRTVHTDRKLPFIPRDVDVSSISLSNIWQPPKSC